MTQRTIKHIMSWASFARSRGMKWTKSDDKLLYYLQDVEKELNNITYLKRKLKVKI